MVSPSGFFLGIPSDCNCHCVSRGHQTPPGRVYDIMGFVLPK